MVDVNIVTLYSDDQPPQLAIRYHISRKVIIKLLMVVTEGYKHFITTQLAILYCLQVLIQKAGNEHKLSSD